MPEIVWNKEDFTQQEQEQDNGAARLVIKSALNSADGRDLSLITEGGDIIVKGYRVNGFPRTIRLTVVVD